MAVLLKLSNDVIIVLSFPSKVVKVQYKKFVHRLRKQNRISAMHRQQSGEEKAWFSSI